MAILSGIAMVSYANLNGNGYYRVRNYGTHRWASLIDNQAMIDTFGATVDMHSMALIMNTEQITTDPGSIIYFNNSSGNSYDIAAQGTTLREVLESTVNIRQDGTSPDGQALYYIYGTKSGATKYLGDGVDNDSNKGLAQLGAPGGDSKKWEILPIDVNSENYFAAMPNVETGDGELFTTIYASFPYKTYSAGMSAYYVGRIGWGIVEMIEVENGEVPAGTPIIIQCAGENPSDNRLQLMTSVDPLPQNNLKGTYFDYKGTMFQNYIAYNPNTMRVLGVCSDGSLGFVTNPELARIPANTAYITVHPSAPAEFKCMNSQEYEAGVDTIVTDSVNLKYDGSNLYSDSSAGIRVMDMTGKTVAKGVGSVSLSSLPKGVYVAEAGGKTIKVMR